MSKIVVLIGSGATRAQAAIRAPQNKKPPLDKGFFSQIRAPISGDPRLIRVKTYLQEQYRYDVFDSRFDSFESVASILYADAFAPRTQHLAYPIFLDLINFLSSRIAETTNQINSNSHSNLVRILRNRISDVTPDNVSVITFNYDLQVEFALRHVSSRLNSRFHTSLVFPGCYRLTKCSVGTIGTLAPFTSQASDEGHIGIPILKLHGSLNWVLSYRDQVPSQAAYLSGAGRNVFRVANVDRIPTDWPIPVGTSAKRPFYGYPVVVPPIPHKSAVFRDEIKRLWGIAADALTNANELLVFGYSCPTLDQEAANLIRSTTGRNDNLNHVTIIDPDPGIAERFVELTNARSCAWFRDARDYLSSIR